MNSESDSVGILFLSSTGTAASCQQMLYSVHLLLDHGGLLLPRVAEAALTRASEQSAHARGVVGELGTANFSSVAIQLVVVLRLCTWHGHVILSSMLVRCASLMSRPLSIAWHLQLIQRHIIVALVSVNAKLFYSWKPLWCLQLLLNTRRFQIIKSLMPAVPVIWLCGRTISSVIVATVLIYVRLVAEIVPRHLEVFFNFLDRMVEARAGGRAAGDAATSAAALAYPFSIK